MKRVIILGKNAGSGRVVKLGENVNTVIKRLEETGPGIREDLVAFGKEIEASADQLIKVVKGKAGGLNDEDFNDILTGIDSRIGDAWPRAEEGLEDIRGGLDSMRSDIETW